MKGNNLLSGLAWEQVKAREVYYCAVLQGLLYANEIMIEDSQKLQNMLGEDAFYGEVVSYNITYQKWLMERYEQRKMTR